MKGHNWVKFLFVILAIGSLTCIDLFGIPKTSFKSVQKGIRYGIDIKGGISAIMVPDIKNVSTKQLEQAKAKIDTRLEGQGVYDKYVNVDAANKRLVIEIPWTPGQENNSEKALEEIGKTSRLTFREVDSTVPDPDLPSSKVSNPPTSGTTTSPKISSSPTTEASKTPEASPTGEAKTEQTATAEATKTAQTSGSPAPQSPATTGSTSPIDLNALLGDDKANEKAWANNTIILEGDDVSDAGVITDNAGKPIVSLKFKSSGAKKFSEATKRLAGKGKIAIYMDDIMISDPNVTEQIDDDSAIITSDFTPESAKKLADQIASGALPFKLTASSVDSISPTLGEGALSVTVYAGIIAFILVCIFMIFFYRLPGLIATVALIGLVAAQLFFITVFKVSLTLPGIAGIILSMGLGVDANVIIFERIKDELRNGRSIGAAVDTGFKRAFAAIFDSNVTTVITSVLLYFLGTGPIKGFAITLFIGVLLSFMSAMISTQVMLKTVVTSGKVRNLWLYGVKGGGKNA